MKKLLALLLLFSVDAFPQSLSTAGSSGPSIGSITASGATCAVTNACVNVHLASTVTGLSVVLSGVFVATIVVEKSADNGVTWVLTDTLSAAGTTNYAAVAMTDFRVRASAYTSGTVAVVINPGGNIATGSSGTGSTALASYTVASLPTAVGRVGQIAAVTDAVTQGSCISGGGALLAFCRSNGTIWQPLGDGGQGGATTLAPVTSGLIAQYAFTDNSGSSALDSSGNGNTATLGSAGNAPTWIGAPTGGLQFGSTNVLTYPAAVSSAKTMQLFYSFQTSQSTASQQVLLANGSYFLELANNACWQGSLAVNCSSQDYGSTQLYPNTTGIPWVALTMNGAGLFTFTPGFAASSNFDEYFLNSTQWIRGGQTSRSGDAGGGTFVSGSTIAGFSYFGQLYYALFYNRRLTSQEIKQNSNVVNQIMANRGITPPGLGNTYVADNQFIADGDSITFGICQGCGGTTGNPYSNYIFLSNGTWKLNNIGVSGRSMTQAAPSAPVGVIPAIMLGAQKKAVLVDMGTNDFAALSLATPAIMDATVSYCAQVRAAGAKCVVGTMLSRSAQDANKNLLNTQLRLLWPTFADGLADFAADPNLGADGANANTTWFATDLTHLTVQGYANAMAPVAQRAVNRLYGNLDFNSAATYTTAATAAVATTAGSQSTNTITVTFGAAPANCQAGNQIVIAGVTPAGYNGTWQILTRSATQVTYYAFATGLGAITVQGTGVCAQEQDADVYAILGGSAAGNPSHTLMSCIGRTGQNIYRKNTNTTSAWVLTPFQSSETIDGATSLTMPTAASGNFPVVVLQAQLVSATAGGCTWKRLQ